MKRKGNIYKNIYDIDNIKNAILNASKGKRKKRNVKRILKNINFYAKNLHEKLKNKNIELTPYKKVLIHDGNRKKEREIFKPAFYPDQCIHWSLMLQIQELIRRGMYVFCCASVPTRGVQYVIKYVKRTLIKDKKNTKYCLQLDIKKFYPNIDKEILKTKFRRIIKDDDTLYLIDLIIDSNEKGLPIGNYTSQWFANFFLQEFDHFVKEKLKAPFYFRYMDDMLIFHRNKKKLRKIKQEIELFLKKENLKLKENWQLFKVVSRPIDFLGYRLYRGYTTIRRSNFLRIKRRVKKVYKNKNIRIIDAQAIISYFGWLKHCNSYNYKSKYIFPYISISECKGVISDESRKQHKAKKI